MNRNGVLFCVCLVCLSACKDRQSDLMLPDTVIKVSGNFNGTLFTDDMLDSIQIIPLETSSESLIGAVHQMYHVGDKYYIQSLIQKEILIFSASGKYLGNLSKVGNGPGEYVELRDFKVDDAGNIYVLGYNELIKYRADGDVVFERKLDFPDMEKYRIFPIHFVEYGDSVLFLWQGSANLSDNEVDKYYGMYQIENDKVVNSYFLVSRLIFGYFQRFYRYGNSYNIQSVTGSNAIYKITPDGVFPNFEVDFGDKNIPPDLLPHKIESNGKLYSQIRKNKNYCGFINSVYETDDCIYFAFVNGGDEYQVLYDKKKATVKVGKINLSDIHSSAIICATEDGKLIGKIEAYDYINDKQNASLDIPEDANPLLIVYHLKK
ncbi:MAG: 6-bladed beta-propeller [Prevotellaceae bacterium]|jgi:RNA binding exosome subunit|nr:6-bladed beta-propeller [Prevotellaceae bacterium]